MVVATDMARGHVGLMALLFVLGAWDVPAAWGQAEMRQASGYVDFRVDNQARTTRAKRGQFTLETQDGPYLLLYDLEKPAGVDIYSVLKLAWRRGWAVTVTGLFSQDEQNQKRLRVTGVYDRYGVSILKGYGINYIPRRKPAAGTAEKAAPKPQAGEAGTAAPNKPSPSATPTAPGAAPGTPAAGAPASQ
ncbi:MAG: hypothetical protein V1816_06190 [Pseudomonadota bacterium]